MAVVVAARARLVLPGVPAAAVLGMLAVVQALLDRAIPVLLPDSTFGEEEVVVNLPQVLSQTGVLDNFGILMA